MASHCRQTCAGAWRRGRMRTVRTSTRQTGGSRRPGAVMGTFGPYQPAISGVTASYAIPDMHGLPAPDRQRHRTGIARHELS